MRRKTISWSHRARRNLLDIGDFISHDKPEAASRWVAQIIEAVERTALFPTSGRVVPEIDRDDIREVVFDNYRIVYQVRDNQIIVLTVFESHRLFVEPDFDGQATE